MSGRWLFERQAAQRRRKRRAPSHKQSIAWTPHVRRIALDLSSATVIELLACVSARVCSYQQRNEPVPHMTRIALTMLQEALGVNP